MYDGLGSGDGGVDEDGVMTLEVLKSGVKKGPSRLLVGCRHTLAQEFGGRDADVFCLPSVF